MYFSKTISLYATSQHEFYFSNHTVATNDQRAKLTKLLSLWESKAKFFDACVISKLQSPDSSMHEYKTNLQNLHHETTTKFTQALKSQMDKYDKYKNDVPNIGILELRKR